MQINGPSHLYGAQSLQGPPRTQGPVAKQPTDATQGADQVDISPQADLISRVRDVPDIRADRVADIRQQIEAGTYETTEKLDVALGRLLDEISG